MNTGVLKVSMVLLIVSLYGCTPQTPENDYDYTAEGDPLLADIVTRFYQPAPEESEQLQGMTRSSYEAWIARAKSSMQELETSIDYESLVTSDQVDYDYFRAQLDNSLLMLEDLRRWENNPSLYIPFSNFFRPSLDLNRLWKSGSRK